MAPPLGIEVQGNLVQKETTFTVDTTNAGSGQLQVYLKHPDGTTVELHNEVQLSSICPQPPPLPLLDLSHSLCSKTGLLCLVLICNEPSSSICVCVCNEQTEGVAGATGKTFNYTYCPTVAGTHQVSITLSMLMTIKLMIYV